MNAEQRQARALELLEQVGIPNPASWTPISP